MSYTKVALILGFTLMSILGAMHYMKPEDNSNLRGYKSLGIQELEKRMDLFKEWMDKYQKTYSVDETHYRFNIWNKAYDFVQDHNSKGLSWTVGTNQFADLTDEEFSSMHLGYNWDPNRVKQNIEILDETDLASSVDWRDKGAVTAIKDQGQCGSCWSFSTSGALEGLYFIKKGTLISFCEQQLIDCSSSYGNQGCNGGLMDDAFKYVKDKGIEKEADYPYKAAAGTCKYNASKVVYKNTGYKDVTANQPTQLQAAVAQQPVSIAVEADQNAFKLYTSGIISSNCGTTLDHGILIVGYNGTSNWIVKNSWGTSWGEKGFVRIAYGTQNSGKGVCGINSDASYPTGN